MHCCFSETKGDESMMRVCLMTLVAKLANPTDAISLITSLSFSLVIVKGILKPNCVLTIPKRNCWNEKSDEAFVTNPKDTLQVTSLIIFTVIRHFF